MPAAPKILIRNGARVILLSGDIDMPELGAILKANGFTLKADQDGMRVEVVRVPKFLALERSNVLRLPAKKARAA